MAQYARPATDTETNGWVTQAGSASNLFDAINEATADDADFARISSPQGETLKVTLSAIADPQTATGHIVRYRIGKSGTETVDFTVALMQGGTEIASWSHTNIVATYTTYAQTLTSGQANAITYVGGIPSPALEYWITASGPTAAYWMDSAYDSRVAMSSTNGTGFTLHDHVLTATLPAGVDATSLRVVETTALGGIDEPFAWRYGDLTSVNRLVYLPASLSGTTLAFKVPGQWATATSRTFHAYWNSGGGIAAVAFDHLATHTADASWYYLKRIGPDTDTFGASYSPYGFPKGVPGTVGTRVSFGRTASRLVRLMSYDTGASYKADAATATLTVNGPDATVTGAITFEPHSGSPDWSGAYTATYRHIVYAGRKSDDTGAHTMNKYVDAVRVNLVYTVTKAYLPSPSVPSNQVTPSNWDALTLVSQNDSFSGNTTIAAGNQIEHFSAPVATGVITEFAASADLSALPVAGTIIGTTGNGNGVGILVNSCTLSSMGSQSVTPHWSAASDAGVRLQFVGQSTGAGNIPVGSTITVDFWLVDGVTNAATTVGDNLLADELVAILRGLAATTPTTTVATAETYRSTGVVASAKLVSTDTVAGIQWFSDNALAYTGLAINSAFQKDLVTGSYANTTGLNGIPDDDDGNYGEAHKLHGLCLRYLRLREPAVLAQIERQVQFHIDIEAAAVATYGSFYSGTAPYWYAATALTKTASEGGLAGAVKDDGTLVPPTLTVNYAQGQVRRLTSVDQMHMVAQGLPAYLYLLRN